MLFYKDGQWPVRQVVSTCSSSSIHPLPIAIFLYSQTQRKTEDREGEKGAWRGLRGWRAACAMMVCGQGVYVRSAHVMACTAPRAFSRVASNREEANTRLGSVDD